MRPDNSNYITFHQSRRQFNKRGNTDFLNGLLGESMVYWYKTCLRCRQGRLFIMKFCEGDSLYLHCEECEWLAPARLANVHDGCLGIHYESICADILAIRDAGWSEYALHSCKSMTEC